jgi:hypothetical protein
MLDDPAVLDPEEVSDGIWRRTWLRDEPGVDGNQIGIAGNPNDFPPGVWQCRDQTAQEGRSSGAITRCNVRFVLDEFGRNVTGKGVCGVSLDQGCGVESLDQGP